MNVCLSHVLVDFLVFGPILVLVIPIIFWGYDHKANCYRTQKSNLIKFYVSVWSLKWILYIGRQFKYECSTGFDNRYPFHDDNPKVRSCDGK